jgi:hypothetical protein
VLRRSESQQKLHSPVKTFRPEVPDVSTSLRVAPQYSVAEATAHISAMQSRSLLSPFRQRLIAELSLLIVIAKYLCDPHIKISYLGYSQSVDGRFLLGAEARTQYIELTPPTDSYDVTDSPERKAGRSLLDDALVRRMRRRIADKVRNAESRPLYEGAWLGIVFGDNSASEARKKKRLDPICTRLLSSPVAYAPFARVFCLTPDGQYVFDSQTLTTGA